MNDSVNFRRLVLSYLLGELPPQDRRELEERMLADRAFFRRLQQAEQNLIDEYFARRLDCEEHRKVEAAFTSEQLSLRSPRTPSRPRFARLGRIPTLIALGLISGLVGWLLFVFGRAPWPVVPRAQGLMLPGIRHAVVPQPPGPATRPPQNHITLLLLVPTMPAGDTTADLHLHPSVRSVHVRWILPPNVTGRTFRLSVYHNGHLVAAVRQHDSLREIGASRVAQFRVASGIFMGARSRSAYSFALSRARNPAPVAARYHVLVHRDYDGPPGPGNPRHQG